MSDLGHIIFDMDGTLVDAMPQHATAFAGILYAHYGISPTISTAIYLETAGQTLDSQFRIALERTNIAYNSSLGNIDRLLEEFWSLVMQIPPFLFADVAQVVPLLFDAGYQLVVISGCASFVVRWKMEKSDLARYLKLMLGTDTKLPGMQKGAGHFKIIQATLGITDEQFRKYSLLVGDGVHDIRIAKEASLLAVGRANSIAMRHRLLEAGADYVVSDFAELLAILVGDDSTYRPIVDITRGIS
jgi:phosphoglycolate phosphatase